MTPLEYQLANLGKLQIAFEHSTNELRQAIDELDPLVAARLKSLIDQYGQAFGSRQSAAMLTVKLFGEDRLYQHFGAELTTAAGLTESGAVP